MGSMNPFTAGPTVSRTVTGSTAQVALGKPTNQVMVTSPSGGAIAFIKFGSDSTVTAAVTDIPILPGTIQIFSIATTQTNVAAIGTSGTTLYFTSGEGI